MWQIKESRSEAFKNIIYDALKKHSSVKKKY